MEFWIIHVPRIPIKALNNLLSTHCQAPAAHLPFSVNRGEQFTTGLEHHVNSIGNVQESAGHRSLKNQHLPCAFQIPIISICVSSNSQFLQYSYFIVLPPWHHSTFIKYNTWVWKLLNIIRHCTLQTHSKPFRALKTNPLRSQPHTAAIHTHHRWLRPS